MGQPDVNDISFADNPNVGDRTYGDLTPTSSIISDKLKFSNSSNGNLVATSITGGKEDCVDFNNGSSNLYVFAGAWRSGGQYVATIKGACSGIRLGGFIEKHGSVVDIDIDNYSDQKHGRSRVVDLTMLRTIDGSAIRWRSWMGVRPIFATDQANECMLCLPYFIGVLQNRGYQLLKILKIAK